MIRNILILSFVFVLIVCLYLIYESKQMNLLKQDSVSPSLYQKYEYTSMDTNIVHPSRNTALNMETHKISQHLYCFVTVFLDIDRSKWQKYSRDVSKYMNQFRNLVSLNIPLVVYIDEKFHENVLDIIKYNRPYGLYTEVISINKTFLEKNIYLWSRLDRERDIMKSESYQNKIPIKRKQNPEHKFPEYTLINHAKIDFIALTMNILHQNHPYKYYGWVDFGYFHHSSLVPYGPLHLQALNLNNINYMIVNRLDELDGDPFYTLQNAPEKVAGAFFFGPVQALKDYQKAYHQAIQELQRKEIADDDQAVVAYIYYNIFHNITFHIAGFKGAFKLLCDGSIPTK